jgi:hypothetical protein
MNLLSWFELKRRTRGQKTNSVAFSLQANYTDWATATCRRNLVPNLRIEGCRVVSAADPSRPLMNTWSYNPKCMRLPSLTSSSLTKNTCFSGHFSVLVLVLCHSVNCICCTLSNNANEAAELGKKWMWLILGYFPSFWENSRPPGQVSLLRLYEYKV